jgi:carotenoid cleavage dioxygenase-like enzyme
MVHGVRLENGTATSYRNRWVRTPVLTEGRRPVDEHGIVDLTASVASTHVIRHAGHVLALAETSFPYELDPGLAGSGTMPFRWDDGYSARLGVLRRGEPYGAVRWFDIDPFYVFHVLNAHEEDGRIALTVVRYPELWRDGPRTAQPAALWRWTIDLTGGRVTEEQLDDRACEFPRIDDRLAGHHPPAPPRPLRLSRQLAA